MSLSQGRLRLALAGRILAPVQRPPDIFNEVTADESVTGEAEGGGVACLILSFQAEQPLAAPRRQILGGADRVTIGRGRETHTELRKEGGESQLRIELSDRFISAPHASLQRVYGRWILHDEESRNGTFVDGAEIERCELRDGAVVEMGRSFFVFRELEPLEVPAPSLDTVATLHAPFAARLRALERVAPTRLPVVLRGESGTGKEVLARAVHKLSKRSGSFQAINCAALAQSLAEAELFGHRKGAFTGAAEERPGLVRSADGGTLFLDEIGDLPLPMQALLLRVLQESEVTPVGGTRPVPVDFRLVVATHRDLDAMAASGAFRPDLLARISGFTLPLPPLRERREDLGALVAALLRRHAGEHAARMRFSLAAARALFRHPWPLNVRELEKALAMAVTLSGADRVDLPHLPPLAGPAGEAAAPPRVLSDDHAKRRDELLALLREHHGNITAVAKALGKARMQVHRWMRRYNIEPAAFR